MLTAANQQIFGRELSTSTFGAPQELPSQATKSPPSEAVQAQSASGGSGAVGVDHSDVPGGSDAFVSELAGIMASYAEQIAAAQMSYPASIARSVIQRLLGERTVAVRNLMERWTVDQRKKQAQRPNRAPSEPIAPPKPIS